MYESRFQHLIDEGYDFSIGDIFTRAFEVFKSNALFFIGITFLVFAAQTALNFMGAIGGIIGAVATGPIYMGYSYLAQKTIDNEPCTIEDFFKPFEKTLPLLWGYLVLVFSVAIGMVLLVIPGIYLSIALMFIFHLVYFFDMPIMEAFHTSRKVATQKWFKLLGFGVVAALVTIAGFIALGIGILVTYPVVMIAFYILFEDIFGLDEDVHSENVMDHFA